MRQPEDWVVGDIVYASYTPAVVGVIRERWIDPTRPRLPCFKVEYLVGKKKGQVVIADKGYYSFNLYENLVAEHEAKAKRHAERLAEMLRLV